MKRWETRCVCGDAHNESVLCEKCDEEEMVCCDRCEKWSHLACLNLDADDIEDTTHICYFCLKIDPRQKAKASHAPAPVAQQRGVVARKMVSAPPVRVAPEPQYQDEESSSQFSEAAAPAIDDVVEPSYRAFGEFVPCLDRERVYCLDQLPFAVLSYIVSFLDPCERPQLARVSRSFRRLLQRPELWEVIDASHRPSVVTNETVARWTPVLQYCNVLRLPLCAQLTDEALASVALGMRTIHALNLAFCTGITARGIGYLARYSGGLQDLNLSGCSGLAAAAGGPSGLIGLEQLLLANPLVSVDLSHMDLPLDTISCLRGDSLRSLNLVGVPSVRADAGFARRIASRWPHAVLRLDGTVHRQREQPSFLFLDPALFDPTGSLPRDGPGIADAARLYTDALALLPKGAVAADRERAIRLLTESVAKAASCMSLYLLGSTLHSVERVGEAIAALERAHSLHPALAASACKLGECLYEQGQTERAVELFKAAAQKAVVLPASFERPCTNLAQHYLRVQRPEAAAPWLLEALRRDPRDTELVRQLASLAARISSGTL